MPRRFPKAFLGLSLALGCAVSLAHAEDQRGRASIGGTVGVSRFLTGGDFRVAAEPRPAGELVFGYMYRSHTQFVSHVGYTWNGYKTCYTADGRVRCDGWKGIASRYAGVELYPGEPAIAKASYATAEIQHNWGFAHLQPHLNLGVGLYGWRVGTTRHAIKDPVTQKELRGMAPGLNVGVGVEDFVGPRVSLDAELAAHYILLSDKTSFPTGFNNNPTLGELRFTARWYFGLGKGSVGPSSKPAGK